MEGAAVVISEIIETEGAGDTVGALVMVSNRPLNRRVPEGAGDTVGAPVSKRTSKRRPLSEGAGDMEGTAVVTSEINEVEGAGDTVGASVIGTNRLVNPLILASAIPGM
jgi:hypothetical protein